jgi:hypothetical protein
VELQVGGRLPDREELGQLATHVVVLAEPAARME